MSCPNPYLTYWTGKSTESLKKCNRLSSECLAPTLFRSNNPTVRPASRFDKTGRMTHTGRIAALSTGSAVSAASIRHEPDMSYGILANVGSKLAIRNEPRDACQLEEWFAPSVTAHELMTLHDHTCVARMAQGGKPIDPLCFEFEALGRS